jgi:lipopolysaccharide/colanic/teichoic acid biosynthesis glycosyltransferase
MRSLAIKRAIDIVGASLGLAVAAVPMAVIAVLIRVTMGKPVLFRQERPGKDGEPFTLVKFRTMKVGDEPDIERLTKVGNFLRATSLDELPELWSVLKGDMSLVGPRPLLMSYLPHYTEREALRHRMRPGVTGLAQVEGRNLLGWDERLECDATYVESWTILGDLKIIFRTVSAVVRRTGISAEGQATMTRFDQEREVGRP